MRVLFTVFVFIYSFSIFSQNITHFEKANALYNAGKYDEAIDLYESILESNVHSTELYFNLGNANYKLNNIAPSIYYYEKALQLNPNNKEIENNLTFARNMTIDAIDKVPEVGFSRLVKNMVNMAKADTWAIIAIFTAIMFVLLFLMYHFSYTTLRKRIAFIISVLSLLISCFSIVMAFQKQYLDKKDNPAIVFVQESRVKSDPNKTGEDLFRLHEGTKVQVLDTYEDWNKIQLSDKSIGWIPSTDIRLLNNFSKKELKN